MIGSNGKIVKHTSGSHSFDSNFLIIKKRRDAQMKKDKVTEIESLLSKCDSSSCDIKATEEYIKMKMEKIDKLLACYSKKIYRILNWYAYIGKQKAETKLVTKIEEAYGKNPILVLGDWVGGNIKGTRPTPMLGLKRRLKKRFELYLIDEFRTSILHYK